MYTAFLHISPHQFGAYAFCALVVIVHAAQVHGQESDQALTAGAILDQMASRYANCKSYRDSGTVETVFLEGTGKDVKKLEFTTAFSPPASIRFEFQYRQPNYGLYRYIIWCRADDVRTYWDATPPEQKHASLKSAVIAAMGVSKGTAYFIPAMLMPKQLEAVTLSDLKEAKRLSDIKLGDHDCFRVRGQFKGESPITLWIDKSNLLLRQLKQNNEFDTFRTEKTIIYAPEINGEIGAKELDFDAPTTRDVPSVPELLGQAPPEHVSKGWLLEIGWGKIAAAVAIGLVFPLVIIYMIRRHLTR